MRKNVLVSILAMTSASTLTAWADANVDQIKTNDVSDWQGAETGVSLENGIIVSQNGAAISQKIGTLVKGSYKITTTTAENVRILINGKALDNGMFEVTVEEENIVIGLEAVESGKEYKVGGLKLMLDFDFAPLRTELSNKLTEIINKIDSRDPNYTSLYTEAMNLSAVVNNLKDEEGTEDKNAYNVYNDYALYNGEASNLHNEINELEAKVNKQADNTAAYNNAVAAYNKQKTAFDEAAKKLEGITDEACKTYVEGITGEAANTITSKLDTFVQNAEEADKSGDAANVCSEENINNFTTEVSKLIGEYADAIDKATANHEAYVRINTCIAVLTKTYNESLTQIYNEVKDDPDVYEDMRQAAQAELNQIYANILDIEKRNGTAENHEGSQELEKELGENWDVEYNNKIAEVTKTYTDKAKNLKIKYADAKEKLSNAQKDKDGLAAIEAIQKEHGEDLDVIQNAINKLSEDVEENNKNHKDVDYTADFGNIESLIETLKESAKGDIANYEAHAAVTAKITETRGKLTAATETVNALNADGYSNEGKYTKTAEALDADITAIADKAKDAFDNGTCNAEDYKAAFAEVEKGIADYIANAETAKENYLNVQETLASYNSAIKELEGIVTNTAVTVGTSGKTYGSYIEDFKKIVSGINALMNTASTSTDDAYNKALADAFAKTDAAETKEFVNVFAGLKDSYAQDKENYDGNMASQAVDRLVTYIETLI